MGERIKKVRKALDLTQQAFADRLGMKQNTIATYEMNRTNPSDPAIKSICREFNVNETWLRTGEGEMFIELPQNEALAAQIQSLLQGGTDSFRERLVSLLLRLPPEHWEVLQSYALELVSGSSIPAAPASAPASITSTDLTVEQEVELEVERYRQQLLTEKRQASQASSVKGSGSA